MTVHTLHTLEAANVSVSGGKQLSGFSQGSGVHLKGETITLVAHDWVAVDVRDNDGSFADSDASQSLDSALTYNGVHHAAGRVVEAEFGLTVEDPDGNNYTLFAFNINEPGVRSYATVEGLGFVGAPPPLGVPLRVTETREGEKNAYDTLASPPCFTTGCRIAVPGGHVHVEELRVGDRVVTADHGAQEIRWIGSRRFDAAALAANEKLRPIRIAPGALGRGLPLRPLRVSRQHRFLIAAPIVERLLGKAEVLIAANKLTALPGVAMDETVQEVTYVHLVLDRHEILFAEGAATESLYTGPEALNGLRPAARAELRAIFPALETPPAPARPIPSNAQQKHLARRHADTLIRE